MANLESRMNPAAVQIKPQDIFLCNTQDPRIVNLTVGEPSFSTPEHIRTAVQQALDEMPMRYTNPQGDARLTEAIANYLQQKYNLNYDPETEIISTIGVTEGAYTTLRAILCPGDEVILPTPCFTIYDPDIRLNKAQPVIMDTSKTAFKVTPASLEKMLVEHPQAKAIIFNYPNNPTGVTYDRAELTALADILRQYDIFVISDEIYSELVYDQKHVSFAEILPEQTILLNGLSKSYSMTGWRLGYICAPQKIAKHILDVHELVTTSIPAPAQVAAVEALTHGQDDSKAMKAQYQERRDVLYQGLLDLGFEIAKPQGAFYIFAKIPAGLNQDDIQLAQELSDQAKVALLPGTYFGAGGQGYLRLSYASSLEQIKLALERLKTFIDHQK
ncbi:aminotransferase class I/II-fold pyridoxal phosphate-dependent enzyme [Lactobacillus sp. DCY120]|uniref:Aminotransferase n=1 Tax=Bombilactobacillus apium TaxID=2675299 RepID=A0A850R755_9LACO|nr:aminotransferase class I/II-fold pyridoxal phosphate-dependent enzyme [Bombilactobacillus apium]NVY96365.1 aminotransferase class I/II-fold pyridoxal phosphate-dependent enzyme [Bombilactobacillus apium]